jgi:hypothetical protein
MSPKHQKDSSLLRLCVYVHPHLIGWAMFDGDFLPIVIALNKNILNLDMLSPLGTACPPIGLEQDSTHVVLIDDRAAMDPCHIPAPA